MQPGFNLVGISKCNSKIEKQCYHQESTYRARSKAEYPPCVRRYCNMARILGLNNLNETTTVRGLISYLQFLAKEMNVPLSVSEAINITREEYESRIDAMAEAALADACTATNPRVPKKEDIIRIYKEIF